MVPRFDGRPMAQPAVAGSMRRSRRSRKRMLARNSAACRRPTRTARAAAGRAGLDWLSVSTCPRLPNEPIARIRSTGSPSSPGWSRLIWPGGELPARAHHLGRHREGARRRGGHEVGREHHGVDVPGALVGVVRQLLPERGQPGRHDEPAVDGVCRSSNPDRTRRVGRSRAGPSRAGSPRRSRSP